MLTYESGDTLAHRLDPRTKLAVQIAFAAAGFVYTMPAGLVALGVVAAGCLRAADASPVSALHDLRYAIPFPVLGPVVGAVRLGALQFDPEAAVGPALVSVRVLLVFFVVTTYARTTSVREPRAAIQLLAPGRSGVALGVGVTFVFRFLPLVRRDLRRVREAQAVHLGSERRLDERLSLVAATGLQQSFAWADALTLALRVRCFAWNPTLPEIRLGWRDVPGFVLAAALFVSLTL